MSYNRLRTEDRRKARYKAIEAIIDYAGPKPVPDQFRHSTQTKLPPGVTRLILFFTFIVLVAAFLPSAMRLYEIGSTTFGHAIPNQTAMMIAGLSSIMLAETGMLLFSLSLAVVEDKTSQRILQGFIGATATYALVGNVQLAMPGQYTNPFAWMEAILPPVAVLGAGNVLKTHILHSIEARHADYVEYQRALEGWKQATANPENHRDFFVEFAKALWDMLILKNRTARREYLQSLSREERIEVIQAELREEAWFVDAAQLNSVQTEQHYLTALDKVNRFIEQNDNALNMTVREVAKAAGVSTGTASKALQIARSEDVQNV